MVLANDLLASISAIVSVDVHCTRYTFVLAIVLSMMLRISFVLCVSVCVLFSFYFSMLLLRINEFGMR